MTSFNNGLKVNVIKGASAEAITSATISCLSSKSTAIDKATEASASASTASAQASIATAQASIATAQASIATTKANEASVSASASSLKANEASSSASSALISKTNAATSEANALSYKDSASTSATIATTKANEALGYRDAALTYQYGAESAYSSTLSLVNNLELPSVTHTVDTVDDFGTIPNGIYTVIVKDINRGGTFIYDATQSAVNNGGTIFDGWTRQYEQLHVEFFGADTEGAEGTVYVQKAVEFAVNNNLNLTARGDSTFGISSPIIIPQYQNYSGRGLLLSFGLCRFKLLADTVLFTSGYYNGGILTSNFGTTPQTYPSSGLYLGDFDIESTTGNLVATSLEIQDWYQGSMIANISSLDSVRILHSSNNFYCNFHNIRGYLNSATNVGVRFFFDGSHNLNKISNLIATNAAVGYQFNGPTTALEISNMSFEGQTVGIEFNSSVYDCTIRDSYFEAISDVMVSVSDNVFSLKLENNYVNFNNSATTYLLTYTGKPANNILIDETNHFQSMPSLANIIKVKEDIYGSGIVIRRFAEGGTSIGDTILDSTIFGANITYEQKKLFGGYNASTSNSFIEGNYSGKYSNGYTGEYGFSNISTGNLLKLETRIKKNFLQLFYVAIEITDDTTTTYKKGLFIGDTYYEADGTGLVVPSAGDQLILTVVGGYAQINGNKYYGSSITSVHGEIRII